MDALPTRGGEVVASGRQIKVYIHPDDRWDVETFVRQELACALLTQRSSDRAGFEVADSEGPGLSRLICPRSLDTQLSPRFIEARAEWLLDVAAEPLIEWWFSRLDGNLLYPGRFYFLPARPGAGMPKSDEFLSIAARLFRWVRAYTTPVQMEWGSERLGPVAANLLQNGEIGLRMNPPGSTI